MVQAVAVGLALKVQQGLVMGFVALKVQLGLVVEVQQLLRVWRAQEMVQRTLKTQQAVTVQQGLRVWQAQEAVQHALKTQQA